MEFRVSLVHADGQHRVVLARAFAGDRCVGSALGEAANAEDAEDRALHRLRQRLPPGAPARDAPARDATTWCEAPPEAPRPSAPSQAPPPAAPSGRPAAAITGPPAPPSPAPEDQLAPPPPQSGVAPPPADGAADPDDWSADLADLDRLVRQLGWGREEERVYLVRLLGQPNRSRLTRYADLLRLRRALEGLTPGDQPATAPLPPSRVELLAQCDELLAQLGWTTEQARESLERHYSVNSRQRLSDDQLLAFNMVLEGELLALAPLEGLRSLA